MKYFTREWACGELSEAEYDSVLPRYNHDLAASFKAGGPVRRFAGSIGLNDAFVDRVVFDRASASLRLLLTTGSLQVGYWHTELTYRGVTSVAGESVLRAALATRPTEIWYDEFVCDGDIACHAVLLAPRGSGAESPGEFAIRFDTFDYAQSPAADRTLLSDDDRSQWGA